MCASQQPASTMRGTGRCEWSREDAPGSWPMRETVAGRNVAFETRANEDGWGGNDVRKGRQRRRRRVWFVGAKSGDCDV